MLLPDLPHPHHTVLKVIILSGNSSELWPWVFLSVQAQIPWEPWRGCRNAFSGKCWQWFLAGAVVSLQHQAGIFTGCWSSLHRAGGSRNSSHPLGLGSAQENLRYFNTLNSVPEMARKGLENRVDTE